MITGQLITGYHRGDGDAVFSSSIHPCKHFSMIVIVIFTQRHLNLDQTNENIMTICCVYITTQDKMNTIHAIKMVELKQ